LGEAVFKAFPQGRPAMQSQLPIKTFVNSLGVFELGKKVKRKKEKGKIVKSR
jgi:hypothetical protein